MATFKPSLRFVSNRARRDCAGKILGMECQTHQWLIALHAPTPACNQCRCVCAKGCASAPANCRSRTPSVGRVHTHSAFVFAYLQAARSDRIKRFFTRQPRGWYKANRVQLQASQHREAAIDSQGCCLLVEREKLPFARGSSKGAKRISHTARQPDFVMPLTVQKYFCAVQLALPHPAHECTVFTQRPHAMPIWYHEQRRRHAVCLAQIPQHVHRFGERRSDIVNGNKQ